MKFKTNEELLKNGPKFGKDYFKELNNTSIIFFYKKLNLLLKFKTKYDISNVNKIAKPGGRGL